MREDPAAVARERVIESMEQSAEVYGLSRSAGRIYGVLYFAGEPLSIPELVERTGYAKSTISNVTRALTRLGLVRRRSSAGGGRRVRYAAEREIWIILQDVLQGYVQRELQTTLRTIRRAERQLPADPVDHDPDTPPDDATLTDADRIRALRETYEEIEEIVALASDFTAGELREALEAYEPDR